MAVSDLTKITTISDDDLVIVEDSDDTKKATVKQLSAYVADDNSLDDLKEEVDKKNVGIGLVLDAEGYIAQEVDD